MHDPSSRPGLERGLGRGLLGLSAVITALGLGACASLPRPSRTLEYRAEATLIGLANGLTIFVAPDRSTSLVQVDLHVRTGSAGEPQARAGLAHLTEHLLFRLRPGDVLLARRLADLALVHNAYTNRDATHVIATGFPAALDGLFAVYRELLAGDCTTLGQAEFDRERHVVLSELRVRGAALFDLVSAIYPGEHPYGHSPGGTLATVAGLTRNDACAFYLNHYVPANATIVVAGAVSVAEVERAAAQMRPLPRREPLPAPVIATWQRPEPRRAVQLTDGTSAVAIVLPFPRRFDALEMAARELSVVIAVAAQAGARDVRAVREVSVEVTGGEQAPVLVLRAVHDQGQHAAAEAALWKAVANGPLLLKEGIAHQTVRQGMRVAVVQSIDTLAQRGVLLADYLAAPEGYGFVLGDLARIDAIDFAAIDRVANEYLRSDLALTLEMTPGRAGSGALVRVPGVGQVETHDEWTVDEDAGELAALKTLADPTIAADRFALDNGLAVVLLPTSSLPIVEVAMIVHAGMNDAPREQPLVPLLAAALAEPNTNIRGVATDAVNFYLSGGHVEPQVRRRSTVFEVRGLSMYVDYLLAGLANEVLAADYRESSVAGLRDALERQREQERVDNKKTQLAQRFAGQVADRARTTCFAALDIDQMRDTRVGPRDLARFKSEFYTADNATLVVSGNFDAALVRAHIEANFIGKRGSAWSRRKRADTESRSGPPRFRGEGFVPRVVAAPERGQIEVALGFALPPKLARDPAARALLEALAEDAVGRVRAIGASYGFHAGIMSICGVDMLMIRGDVDPTRAREAMRVLHGGLESLRVGAALERPIARARRVAVRTLVASASEARVVATRVAERIEHGAEHEDPGAAGERAARFPAPELRALLAETLKLEMAEMLCVGPADAAKEACDVDPRGGVIDPFTEPPPEPAPAAPSE